MKWIINDEVFTDAAQAAEYIAELMDEEAYDDMLDDAYGEINICGTYYSASVALYRIDEVAYNCGFSEYKDSQADDIRYQLERMTTAKKSTTTDI